VVAANLFRDDPRVRQGVLEAIDKGSTNVMIWGDSWTTDSEGPVTSVEHRLSIAARALKKEALAAAGASLDSVGLVETFRSVASGPSTARLRACDDYLASPKRPHDDAGGLLDRLDGGGEVRVGPQLADRVLP